MNYPIRTLLQIRPLLVGFRKRIGLSQADVASLLGVTQQSYAKIEAKPSHRAGLFIRGGHPMPREYSRPYTLTNLILNADEQTHG